MIGYDLLELVSQSYQIFTANYKTENYLSSYELISAF